MAFPKVNLKDLTCRVPFGKYKGAQIGYIITNDPEYAQYITGLSNVSCNNSIKVAISTFLNYAR